MSVPPDDSQNARPQYTFYNSSSPVLEAGSYTLEAKQIVTIDGTKSIPYSTGAIKFYVAGERFSLQPGDIQAVFPPEGSRGNYMDCLPHIVLNRNTLPWERHATGNSNSPWLALLLLSADEEEEFHCEPKTISLQDYSASLDLEPGQQKTDPVQVIELPFQFLQQLLPSKDELPLLCHVRVCKVPYVDTRPALTNNSDFPPVMAPPTLIFQIKESPAVIVGNRLPVPKQRNRVYLISLHEDNYYDPPNRTGNVKLITLKSWDFFCEETHANSESLDQLFATLTPAGLRLPLPGGNTAAEPFLATGSVALPHRLRTGETSVSWYRGPLLPGKPDTAFTAGLTSVNSADALLRYHSDIGMLDVTYAAAWELGRLLTLQNRAIAACLSQWRYREECLAHCLANHGTWCAHLPAVQRAMPGKPSDTPAELTQWIDDLRRLKGIPFRYLLPDEGLLPAEAIAFFYVDPYWIDSLIDGALSLVRAPTLYREHCRNAESTLLCSCSRHEILTGFLLRSAAVSGWPDPIVAGYPDKEQKAEKLEIYRSAKLSPNILLYLFVGELKSVTLEQKPETLHWVINQEKQQQPSIWKDKTKKILKITELSAKTPAELATRLLHKTQKLKIKVSTLRPGGSGKPQLNVIGGIQLGGPDRILQLAYGDLTRLKGTETVDFLVVPVPSKNYEPAPGTMVRRLQDIGISIAELSKIPINDSGYSADQYRTWISRKFVGQGFKYIVCCEYPASPKEIGKSVFKPIHDFIKSIRTNFPNEYTSIKLAIPVDLTHEGDHMGNAIAAILAKWMHEHSDPYFLTPGVYQLIASGADPNDLLMLATLLRFLNYSPEDAAAMLYQRLPQLDVKRWVDLMKSAYEFVNEAF